MTDQNRTHFDEPTLTTAMVSERLLNAAREIEAFQCEYALERATCARLLAEKDAEIARLTKLSIELTNLTAKGTRP